MRIINCWEHTSCGNGIEWMDNSTICGWLEELPKTGDEVRSETKDGRIACYKVTNVNRMSDPPDMFFAQVRFTGYMEKQ